eukprot:COSAG06_NODE_2160_length_7447_cov_500.020822_3_plen_98_part_00
MLSVAADLVGQQKQTPDAEPVKFTNPISFELDSDPSEEEDEDAASTMTAGSAEQIQNPIQEAGEFEREIKTPGKETKSGKPRPVRASARAARQRERF